ncbi:radical SAM protein [Gordonia sp. TBRC 11910]|uniref:Radical SAM protein n=1 Tax=Gordonia asplenii TaxID=2725283 RepID=A0A848KKY0_9ACTN|nr:radical SAM protein [Gordonia asplenii]NMN99753.1 radical SAM protein [Gordonia asplenii]
MSTDSRPRLRRTYAVWELTLACNLACSHCGSRAGSARPDEMSTAQALDVVDQLAEVGIEEVTLIGGEAFLRRDWLQIAAAITARGMRCTVTTGGYKLSAAMAHGMWEAGITQASISIDGMAATHDALRGRTGSWESCLRTADHLRAAGLAVACNTQVNRRTAVDLPELYDVLSSRLGIIAWQLQLTVPMGSAADHPDLLLQPPELLVVFPVISRIARRSVADGVQVYLANSLGYHGPDESLLRFRDSDGSWQGCQAGVTTLGIEADGAIKGCPSLPSAPYTGGNVRDRRIADIKATAPELTFNLRRPGADARDGLWGFCATCEYADTCRGGCSWSAHTLFGRRGNNPLCHHRALTLQREGLRERLIPVGAADGLPFDYGRFTMVTEPADAQWPPRDTARLTADAIRWPADWPTP